jgi:hypothetical protein
MLRRHAHDLHPVSFKRIAATAGAPRKVQKRSPVELSSFHVFPNIPSLRENAAGPRLTSAGPALLAPPGFGRRNEVISARARAHARFYQVLRNIT